MTNSTDFTRPSGVAGTPVDPTSPGGVLIDAAGTETVPSTALNNVWKGDGVGGWVQGLPAGGTPAAHSTVHKHGGGDEVATATPAANAIPKAGAGSTVDSGWLPAATESAQGALEIATQAEVDAETDDVRAITPLKLATKPLGGDLAGTIGAPEVKQVSAAWAVTADLTPATIGANQDDYDPTDLATSSSLRLTASADYDITGLAGGADGRVMLIHNIDAANTVTLKHENAGSTAVNRFTAPGARDVILPPGATAALHYDATSSRWRVTGHAAGAVVGSTIFIFLPALPGTNAGGSARTTYSVISVGTTGSGFFSFKVPADFGSLVSAHVDYIATSGSSGIDKDIDLTANYGAEGEAHDANTETDTATLYVIAADGVIGELDITPVLTGIAADDYVGLEVDHNGIGGGIDYIGIDFVYIRNGA